jgi:hypothetical protein
MQAQKFLLTTNAHGKLEGLPEFLPNQHVELILLFNEENTPKTKPAHRKPPAELAGKMKILGDIISPVVDENEWDVMK